MTTHAQVRQFGRNDRRSLLDEVILSASAALANCPVATIDKTIISTLKELCRAEGADQAGWSLLREGSGIKERFASVSSVELLDRVNGFNSSELPWCRSRLVQGQAILLTDLTGLPKEAETDRTYLQRFGVQSLALVPIDAGELSRSMFTMLSLGKASCWSSALARQCAFLGNAFLSAHARKVTHQEMENSDSNFRELFRSASVGMAIEDTSGGLLYVNEALSRMLGYKEAEMIQRRCVEFSHPADYEREAVLFDQLFKGDRQSYEIEKRFLHRNGSTVWGRVTVTLLRKSPSGPRLVLGIVEDITRQKSAIDKLNISQLEVQSLASRLILSQEDERRRIARELHDDIGQRLSMVTSELHLLKTSPVTEDGTPLTSLGRLVDELDTMVTDLHDLSRRLHSSKLQHLGVKSAFHEFCRQLARSGLRVDLTLDEELEQCRKKLLSVCIASRKKR